MALNKDKLEKGKPVSQEDYAKLASKRLVEKCKDIKAGKYEYIKSE